jgi:hypothetical protein
MVTESYDASRGVAKIDQWMRRNRQHPRIVEAVTKLEIFDWPRACAIDSAAARYQSSAQ